MIPARAGGGRNVRVLVAADTPENLRLLTTFLEAHGYDPVTARDGQEAVRACRENMPDLVIMDAAMPAMDGLEATRAIRRLSPDRWIPVLVLGAYSVEQTPMRDLDVDVDDYLVKPVNLAVLAEKLETMRRIVALQHKLADDAARLEDPRHPTRSEEEFARHLLEHLTGQGETRREGLEQWVLPAAQFSGDVLVHARGPAGERYLMMADAAGHGLAAAMSVLPLVEAFRRLAEEGYTVPSIVTRLNGRMRRLLPRERFVAALVVAVDELGQSLQIWNGGLPEALFLDPAGRVLRSWPSRHMPLGVLPDEALNAQPEVFSWSTPGQLVIHTDGLSEAEDRDHREFGSARVQALLCATPPELRFAALKAAVEAHAHGVGLRDDVSLAVLDCGVSHPLPEAVRSDRMVRPRAAAATWSLTLRLGAAELRKLDVVPVLMSGLDPLQLDASTRGTVFTVLSELVNNAIDHGLLELDSAIKHAPDGFERYIEARTERLARLSSGWVEIALQAHSADAHGSLTITVTDSGKGFSYAEYLRQAAQTDALPSGRGILLVKRIAQSLHYEGEGNRAVARVAWGTLPAR